MVQPSNSVGCRFFKILFVFVAVNTLFFCLTSVLADPNLLWSNTYGGSTDDYCRDSEFTSDGGFILVGGTSLTVHDYDVYLVKTNSLGELEWDKTYGGSGYDNGYAVKELDDGGYILSGVSESFGAGGQDVYLIRTDSLGNLIWNNTYGGTSNEIGYSIDIKKDYS